MNATVSIVKPFLGADPSAVPQAWSNEPVVQRLGRVKDSSSPVALGFVYGASSNSADVLGVFSCTDTGEASGISCASSLMGGVLLDALWQGINDVVCQIRCDYR